MNRREQIIHGLRSRGWSRIEAENEADEREAKAKRGHYGPMCMDPDLCAGKGYCPRDPNCAD